MAHYRKRGKAWTVELYRHGVRESATFHSKAEAAAWAHMRESELVGAKLPDKTLDDALARYGIEKAPKLGGARWAANKLRNLRAFPLAKKPLAAIKQKPDLTDWRDVRLGQVAPATVNRELNLMRSVFEAAIDWGWLTLNPMARLKRPKNPQSRKRRISQAEIDAVCKGLGYVTGPPVTLSQRVALAFLFALQTAMRGGEIVRLQWAHVGELSVYLPKTKNGDERHVPLSTRAREILAVLPRAEQPCFGLTDAQKDGLFRAGRKLAGLGDLHFHDSRAEAIWRLSKKLDVLELARVIGHRNIASLMLYYNASADELAAKLD